MSHRWRSAGLVVGCVSITTVVACYANVVRPLDIGLLPPPSACVGITAPHNPNHVLTDSQVTPLIQNGYCNLYIPEYHDEQRLSDGAGDYGPVAYAFAPPSLGALTSHNDFDNDWVNVAIIDVRDATSIPDTYKPLHLEFGTNCLYLYHDHGFFGLGKKWRAAIGRPQGVGGLCNGQSVTTASVRRYTPSPDAEDYPAVARWIERANGDPMLGVGCGDGWCVVGAKSLGDVPEPTHAGLVSEVVAASPRWKIHGWFDDQVLGVPTVEGKYNILRAFQASIVPHEDLGTKAIADFRADWVQVASVVLPRKYIPPKYAGELLATGKVRGYGLSVGQNTIYMRAFPDADTLIWRARIVNHRFPAGLIRLVTRTDHSEWDIPVPPTARWRWDDKDETIWVACGRGCCMVEEEDL